MVFGVLYINQANTDIPAEALVARMVTFRQEIIIPFMVVNNCSPNSGLVPTHSNLGVNALECMIFRCKIQGHPFIATHSDCVHKTSERDSFSYTDF